MKAKPLALFDIDNTLYNGFSLLPLAEREVKEGVIERSTAATLHEILTNHRNGEINYEPAIAKLLKIYASGLAGKSYSQTLASARHFFKNTTDFYEFSAPLIARLRVNHNVMLVTGEPQHIAQAVVEVLEADGHLSTVFEIKNDKFTGRIETSLSSRHDKATIITGLISGQQPGSLAFGDSEGDIEMLKAVDHAICINPSAGLKEVAIEQGWKVASPETVEATVAELLNFN